MIEFKGVGYNLPLTHPLVMAYLMVIGLVN